MRPHEAERPLFTATGETREPGVPPGLAQLFPRLQPMVLDRLDEDGMSGHETRPLKALKPHGAWLTRFLSGFSDRQDDDHPNRAIEVVLPGKGKERSLDDFEHHCREISIDPLRFLAYTQAWSHGCHG